jgi:hypothetical protein
VTSEPTAQGAEALRDLRGDGAASVSSHGAMVDRSEPARQQYGTCVSCDKNPTRWATWKAVGNVEGHAAHLDCWRAWKDTGHHTRESKRRP